MIRTVQIPRTVSRMGCAPGSGCCSACSDHKPLRGLHEALTWQGPPQTQCDDSGNCWVDGELVKAPLTTGTGCPPGYPECLTSTVVNTVSAVPKPVLYLGGGVVAALILNTLLGGRRR